MVANDDVAEDEMQKSVLRMAAPAGIRTSLITLEKACANIMAEKYKGQRVFMILKSPKDALRLLDMGLPIETINAGNMAGRPDTKKYKRSLSLTEAEYQDFMTLHERGVKLTAQMVPEEALTDLMEFLK